MQELYCEGCGVAIQSSDPGEPGYTPPSALNRENVLCRRCFRLKHYNELEDVSFKEDAFFQMVNDIHAKEGLIVHVVDIFDLDGTLYPGLMRMAGDNPILLAANKMDVLPASTNRRKLEHWLRRSAKDKGIRVKDVCLISSYSGEGFNDLTHKMDDYRMGKDVYIIGTTNVGKSTLINRLIRQSTGEENVITTSYFPGTTLGFIEIPLDDQRVIVDTPGIINHQQITHYLSSEELKTISPYKEIKPRVYQLEENQTLFFGGFARIDILKGDNLSAICFFSNQLPIHRTKLEKADDIYTRHRGAMLHPPKEDTLKELPELVQHSFKIKDERTDIVFSGLGWVSFPDGNVTVEAHYPKGLGVTIRPSIL